MLLVLGLSSLVSILATGALIDRHLRTLTLAACGLLAFATAVLAAALLTSVPWPVYGAATLWGVVVVAGPVDPAGDGHDVVFVLSVGGVLLVAAVRGHASP
ncbi:hypothetical protein ACFW5D_34640 [Streptomyces sp. NPDC058770]|uniref:hypothetical protein n=1 Tax=Streptomyces sp. NPDC058770 TaxID=3346631 RepID=UPI0036B638DA